MSKIQEALKKIQGEDRPDRSGSASRPEQVATVVLETLSQEDIENGRDSRVVRVDQDLLRSAGLLAPEHQQRHIADQYRLIKRPILDLAAGNMADSSDHANLVMVASALSGDGKTFTTINLALSIASEKDTTVLLVDADVAKPHISNLFGVNDEPGLIDMLNDHSLTLTDTIIRTDVPGLSILPSGKVDAHATELLASKRMASVAMALSKADASRIVIFDSPPLLATSESRVLASRMGQIALVVCGGKTPQKAVLEAISSIDDSKAINLILNQAGSSSSDGYYGGYHYGYGASTGE
jgi:exopolysaccharide/PEP-CTERM locus tyrosine autokinase